MLSWGKKNKSSEESLLRAYRKIESNILDVSEDICCPETKNKLPDLLAYHGTLNSICAVHAENFMLVLNNSERDYYGEKQNDVSHLDLSFARSILHPSSFITALHSQTFFGRPQEKLFQAFWKLKRADRAYYKFYGITGTIATNEEGLATHVLSIKCRQDCLTLFHALELFDLQHIAPRSKEVLKRLLDGYTIDEIASQIDFSSKTIEKEVTDLYRAAKVKNRAELLEAVS